VGRGLCLLGNHSQPSRHRPISCAALPSPRRSTATTPVSSQWDTGSSWRTGLGAIGQFVRRRESTADRVKLRVGRFGWSGCGLVPFALSANWSSRSTSGNARCIWSEAIAGWRSKQSKPERPHPMRAYLPLLLITLRDWLSGETVSGEPSTPVVVEPYPSSGTITGSYSARVGFGCCGWWCLAWRSGVGGGLGQGRAKITDWEKCSETARSPVRGGREGPWPSCLPLRRTAWSPSVPATALKIASFVAPRARRGVAYR